MRLPFVLVVWLVLLSCGTAQEQHEQTNIGDSEERSSLLLAQDAAIALQNKDYDKAIGLLRTAIARNPGDAGATYDPTVFGPTSEIKALYGRDQLMKMLTSHPTMKKYLDDQDDLWKWTERKYSETIFNNPIEWDATPPIFSRTAEHSLPRHGHPAKISLRDSARNPNIDGSREAFEKLWCSAVFELHNIDNDREFHRIDDAAREGTLSQDEYVKLMFQTELIAVQRTRKWYVEIYLPHAKKYQLPTRPENWYCHVWWGSKESALKQCSDKSSYPWDPYRTYYLFIRLSKLQDSLFGHQPTEN